MLVRCAQLSIKAQRLVVTIWILLTVAGVLGALNLDKHLTTSLEIPGSPSAAASQVLNKEFAENTEGTFTSNAIESLILTPIEKPVFRNRS